MADGRRLNVMSDALNRVGNRLEEVSNDVSTIFSNLEKTVEAITSNDSWAGEASREFAEKFDSFVPRFKSDLNRLAELGPTLRNIATNYANAEAENAGMIGR